MPGKGLLPDPGPSAGGARRLSPGGPGLLRPPSTDPGQASHGSGFMGGRQSPQQHHHQHQHGGGGRHTSGKRSSGDRGMGSWQGPAKRSRGSNGQQRDNPYLTSPGGNARERSQQQAHTPQALQQNPAGPPAGAAVPRPVSVYNGPREGSRGLALGFNYWVHDSRRILASDVRELVTSILCGTTPPPFVRTKDVSSLRRVVVAVVQGMPSQQVLGELPRCPTLSAMSVAPTVFAAEHVSKPEQMIQASTALLWGPQPHVAIQDLAGRPLRHIFKTHALYFVHGDTKAQAKWEDRLLFRPSSPADDTHAEPGDDGGMNAGSAVDQVGGGDVELEEGEQEEDAEAVGTVVRLKGHDKGTWSLKGGRELRLVWPDGTVEVLTAEPWPSSSSTLGSSKTAASATAALAEGTLTFTGAAKGQEGTTARLTLVEAVLTDVFDENEARDKQQGISEADDSADPPLAPGGLQANRWLVDAVEAMTDAHINAFALTEQERLRVRYPISIRAEGSIGWVSPGTGALLEEPAPVPAVPGDDGGWVEEDYGGWGDDNGGEDNEEKETSATNGHADSSADADMAVDNGVESGVAGGFGDGEKKDEEENGRRSRLLGIDCEMCKTEHGLELSRITLVDVQGELVLDRFVQPGGRIVDYNTAYSGVSADHLDGVTTTLKDVQRQLVDILEEVPTFLVGHALDGDLRALRLVHSLLIDTSALYPHPKGSPWKRSLKDLAKDLLGRDIQQGHGTTGHDSRQDACAALELAMLKMVRGHEFMVPGPWSQDPSQQPRESLFRRVSRACKVYKGGRGAVVAVGPMHGMALHGNDEQGRRPNRVWSSYNRGYRREGDGVWTAAREDGGSVCSVECGSADDIVEQCVKAMKGDGVSSPSLLWVDMPCKDYYSYVNQAAASVEAPRHFTNLEMIDGAIRRLLDAADDTTLVAVSVQGDTYPVYSLLETKQRCRWDEPRKGAARPGIAGTVRAAWTEEDERQLLAAAIDTLSGVTFLGVKTT